MVCATACADDHLGVALSGPYPDRAAAGWAAVVHQVTAEATWTTADHDGLAQALADVSRMLAARADMTDAQVAALTGHLVGLLRRPHLPIPLQTSVMARLVVLLRRYRSCNMIGHIDADLLYKLLADVHLSAGVRQLPAASPKLLRAHREHLQKLVAKAKRFFAPDTPSKLQDILWKHSSSPHNTSYYVEIAVLHLFMPVVESHLGWIPELMTRLSRTDPNSATTSFALSLLSRVAKALPATDLSAYIQLLFQLYLHQLPLTIAGVANPNKSQASQNVYPSELHWLLPSHGSSRYLAKLAVYCIGQGQTISNLRQLFHTTATFFHPSNGGPWTDTLADLLFFTAQYFVRRYWTLQRSASPVPEETVSSFLDIVLPVAMSAIYSRSPKMSYCAQAALRHLSYVAPQRIFPPILDEMSSNLTNPSHAARTLSSLSLMASVSHPLFHRTINPSGATVLLDLLWGVLEHIDAVNFLKSAATMSFIGTIFYNVALLSGASCMTDDDEDARHASLAFPEWALAFLEKICEALRHADTLEKGQKQDQGVARMVFRMMRPFFCNLSADTHRSCCEFLLAFLTSHSQIPARKYFGVILRVASLGHSKQLLDIVATPIIHRLAGDGSNAAESLSIFSDGEAEWQLYLLSNAVRFAGGDALLAQIKPIGALVDAATLHESKTMRKVGRKLLRNTLRALTETYPTEFRPFGPKRWRDPAWAHWQSWGTFVNDVEDDLSVEWHCPSKAEVEAASCLASVVLERSRPLLSASSHPNLEDTLGQLMNVRAVLEGTSAVAGDFEGTASSAFHFGDIIRISGVSLRTWLTRSIIFVSRTLTTGDNSEAFKPEIWTVFLSVCDGLFNVVEASSESVESLTTTNKSAISSQREYASGHKCSSRALLVEQALCRYLQLARLARSRLSLTADVVELVDHSSDKAVLGASEAMRQSRLAKGIASSWDSWRLLAIALSDSGHHKDDLVQAELIALFTVTVDQMHTLPVDVSPLIGDLLCIVKTPGLHWRCELTAARFLHSLIRLPNPDLRIIEFFTKAVQSDFVPLRRIALSALTLMADGKPNFGLPMEHPAPSDLELASATRTTFYDRNDSGWEPESTCIAYSSASPDVVKPCLDLSSFSLDVLVKSLEEDHHKLSSAKGETGAGHVIARTVPDFTQSRLCWPRTALGSVHDLLSIEHIMLVSGLGPSAAPRLVSIARSLLDRDQQAHNFRDGHVTAAEIFAGCAQYHPEGVSDLLLAGIDHCTPDLVKDWSSAIRFAVTDVDPLRVMWLVDLVVDQALGSRISAIHLASAPYQKPSLPTDMGESGPVRQSIHSGSSRPTNMSDILDRQLSTAKHDNSEINSLETMLTWATFTVANCEACYAADIIIKQVPAIISSCHHPNPETAALAKHCLAGVSWLQYSVESFDAMVQACTVLCSHTSWHVRSTALSIMRTLAVRHTFFLDASRVTSLSTLFEKALADERIECREIASQNVTGLMSCSAEFISIDKISRRFMKSAKTSAKDSGSLLQRHAGVLGLAALIRSEPYGVPEWLPGVLAFCAPYIHDPAPIGPLMRKVFGDFMRTHQDTWHVDQEKFNEDELTAVKEAVIAPSYFA
ncbi:unnamed protein product (mitochondrion) [Plasmodiophora brassicae]|uniref:Proteasome activator complex subunit 4 C-terminal domain-containing protein n=1 Tax=Plasmodiophora brassicae TaxID=37360 RepID=A0A3P3Y4F1_PLABS|nr:unnamed protein product [Plasmodiophora brassicae]